MTTTGVGNEAKPQTKHCTGCGLDLGLEAFDLKQRGKPWLFSRCRDCRRNAAAERKRRNSAAARANPKPKPSREPFPGDNFLRFRALCMAYRHHRTGKVVRATSSWFMEDLYRKLHHSRRVLCVMPPASGKSSMLVDYCTWSIMRDRGIRITIIAKNADEAKKLLQQIQQRLSDSALYDHLAAELVKQGDQPTINPLTTWFADAPFKPSQDRAVGQSWGAFAFRVEGRNSPEKEATVEAKGVMGPVQGIRSDLIVCDDLQDPSVAVKSPAQSAEMLQWFQNVLLGRVSDSSRVCVLANFFAEDDFAHRLLAANGDTFEVVKYPALIPGWLSRGEPEPTSPTDEPLVPTWDAYWTREALELKRREVGATTWETTWMQAEGGYRSATFKRDVLEGSLDPAFSLGQVPAGVSDIAIGCDPAVAATGWCAIVVLGLTRKTKVRWLIEPWRKQGMRTWDAVAAELIAMTQKYAPLVRTVTIEINNVQGSLAFNPTLQREIRSTGARVATYQTMTGLGARAETSNFDITTLGGLFDAGLVRLPGGGTYDDQRRVAEFIDELCNWRTDEQGRSLRTLVKDQTMALLFSESALYPIANRKTEPLAQNTTRAPLFARDAWHRFDRKGPSTVERQSARLAALKQEADAAIDEAIEGAR